MRIICRQSYFLARHLCHDGCQSDAICRQIGNQELACYRIFMQRIGTIFVERSKRSDTLRTNHEISTVLSTGNGFAFFQRQAPVTGQESIIFTHPCYSPPSMQKLIYILSPSATWITPEKSPETQPISTYLSPFHCEKS